MSKLLNLNHTVFEISKEYPEIVEILKDLGFQDIIKPGMLQTAGRFMTIPKGAVMKKINIDKIIETLNSYDFQVIEEDTI